MQIFILSKKKIVSYSISIVLIAAIFGWSNFYTFDLINVISRSLRHLPIYSVNTEQKVASLTFDCAWGNSDIPDILKALKEENVKATFFIVGEWAEKYPNSVKAIAKAGHDVANHSYAHPHMNKLEEDKIKEEIRKTNQLIESLTGVKNNLFRAPYLEYNDKVIATAKNEGYYTIQYDVDSLDWKEYPSEQILQRVNDRIRNGSIILLHNDTKYTSKTLSQLIKSLKAKGYVLVPVSQLIYKDNYYIDNQGRQFKE